MNEENEHTKWRDKDKERPLVNLQLQPGLAGPWLKSLHYWCRPWSPTSCPDATHAQSTLGREGWQGSSRKSYWSNKCFKIIKSKIHYHPWCSKRVSSRILICMISIDIQCQSILQRTTWMAGNMKQYQNYKDPSENLKLHRISTCSRWLTSIDIVHSDYMVPWSALELSCGSWSQDLRHAVREENAGKQGSPDITWYHLISPVLSVLRCVTEKPWKTHT